MNVKGNSFFLASGGQLVTDRFGMSSAVAMWFYSGLSPETAVRIHSQHPRWNFLDCDKTIVTRRPDGAWDIQATYFGVVGTPDPIYTLEQTLSNEPIETHPKFETFAGTSGPSKGLNGAYFDPVDEMFVNFKQVKDTSGSVTNRKWVGVRDYLAPGMVWRKTYTTKTKPDASQVGLTVTPPGSPPPPQPPSGFSGTYNWLAMGMSYDQKGLTYQVREEWRLSGPNGWNTDLYPAGTAV